MSENKIFSCKCGWAGNKLDKSGCVTHADTWYICPRCGEDASKSITYNKPLQQTQKAGPLIKDRYLKGETMTEAEILETRIRILQDKLILITEEITFETKVLENRLAVLWLKETSGLTPTSPDKDDFEHGPF